MDEEFSEDCAKEVIESESLESLRDAIERKAHSCAQSI